MDSKSEHARPETPKLTPHLICRDAAAAIDFYKKAFGASELIRLPGPDGLLMHACLAINGGYVFLADENCGPDSPSPLALGGTPMSIHLSVDDVDAAVRRAVDAGARLVMPVEDMFWGDRFGMVEDPFGHRWSLATPQRQVTEDELRQGAKAAIGGKGKAHQDA